MASRHLLTRSSLSLATTTAAATSSRRLAANRSWTCAQCLGNGRQRHIIPSRALHVSPATRRLATATSASPMMDGDPLPKDASPLDTFPRRHIGPSRKESEEMLKALDPPVADLDDFVKQVVPADIRSTQELHFPWQDALRDGSQRAHISGSSDMLSESQMASVAASMSQANEVYTSYIGCGYYGTKVPEVIKRNVLENPAWYTSYTPYQPEVSQGRLESLLNFQTMVCDLTALPIANASLLDESTAAAEAMTLSMNAMPASRLKSANKTFLVSHLVHPQTIAVLKSRAAGFGIQIELCDVLDHGPERINTLAKDLIGVLVQYPDTEGGVEDFRSLSEAVHKQGALLSVATDLLALTVLTPPGEFGADIAFGNAQRFGVPMGYGGPHAAFFAVADKYKRKIPGRLVGVSKDRLGDKAMRLTLQTREQHIRREKATSNVCTAQALLANMSALYACYHGPQGLKAVAENVIQTARRFQVRLAELGYDLKARGRDANGHALFDTVVINVPKKADALVQAAKTSERINIRRLDQDRVSVSFDETSIATVQSLLKVFESFAKDNTTSLDLTNTKYSPVPEELVIPEQFRRRSEYLTHEVFNTHHSETEMLRYIHHLGSKDLSLVHSMIPLGSCTMKLNGSVEMAMISLPGLNQLHPFAPRDQAAGYSKIISELSESLALITGFDAVSLQPNSGAQGEFAGLRLIRRYHEDRPGPKRDICFIPVSAHGTNPASAAMAGMRVVTIKCDARTGNLDMQDLETKCKQYKDNLGAIMVTYPSTFGVFEPEIKSVCKMIHNYGGQVYMDGANMNAQIGLCSPGEIGADVCHLNLHKTFCIPHGGGGPGVGPVCVKKHLEPYLPGHPLISTSMAGDGQDQEKAIEPTTGAPFGSASILPISWAYICMMGGKALTTATKITLLNANYIMSRLRPHYPIMYTNANSRCAHEFILDTRGFKDTAGIEAIDIAKRLQDYGFHAPTMSWPVANTLMIEPTESESKAEMDRYIDALISIRQEIRDVEEGRMPREGNVLKMAPHSMKDLLGSEWQRPYSRELAAYPLPWLKEKKFWPSVTRVDDAYGDLNLFCTCGPVDPIDEAHADKGITGAAAPMPT